MKNKLIITATAFLFIFLGVILVSAQENTSPTTPIPNPETIQPIIQPTEPLPSSPIQQPPPTRQPQPQPLAPPPTEKPMPTYEDQTRNEEADHRDFIEPREIQEVLRQIRDIKREASRILKKANKAGLTNEASQINELLSQIAAIESILKGPVDAISRETLQEFYDSQAWELLNSIRIKVELPNEIKAIERELGKLEKMIGKRNFAVEGVDMSNIKSKIEEIKAALREAKNNLSQNSLEEANEALQVIHEGGFHPGEMMSVLNRLSEITKRLKRIKSQEIKNDIKEFLEPIYEAVNSGDFREANMMLSEIDRDLWRIMDSLRNRSSIDGKMRANMDKLEQKMQQRMQGGVKENNENKKQSYYNYKNYPASLMEAIADWIGL